MPLLSDKFIIIIHEEGTELAYTRWHRKLHFERHKMEQTWEKHVLSLERVIISKKDTKCTLCYYSSIVTEAFLLSQFQWRICWGWIFMSSFAIHLFPFHLCPLRSVSIWLLIVCFLCLLDVQMIHKFLKSVRRVCESKSHIGSLLHNSVLGGLGTLSYLLSFTLQRSLNSFTEHCTCVSLYPSQENQIH